MKPLGGLRVGDAGRLAGSHLRKSLEYDFCKEIFVQAV